MPRASSRSSLIASRSSAAALELADQALRLDPGHPPRLLEPDRDPGQVLLRPVVQRALNASPLLIAGGDETGSRRPQLGQLGRQHLGQLAVLDVGRQRRVDLVGPSPVASLAANEGKGPAPRAEAQRAKQEGERDDRASGGNEPAREPSICSGTASSEPPKAVDQAESAASTAANPMAITDPTMTGPTTARVNEGLPASRRTDRIATAITANRTTTLAHSSTNSYADALSKKANGFVGPPNSGYVLGDRGTEGGPRCSRGTQEQYSHHHPAGPTEEDRGESQRQQGQRHVVVALEGETEHPDGLDPVGP